MNYFVFPYQRENFYVCPDSALGRPDPHTGSLDYFIPDGIETLRAIPFVYVKISRTGKSLRPDYAWRHYSECGWGVHLCTFDVNEGNILDRSMFFSHTTKTDGDGPYEGFEFFDSALQRASQYMTLRIGDAVILELEDIQAFEIQPDRVFDLSYKDFTIALHS